ncbi:hypothetical protein DFH09DRAFT_1377292 [Mycena vulgaris]|nr:hypothetical protein DFH09DRAFT_1377292 [Mycena vulgaris]
MPLQPTVAQIRLDNVLTALSAALTTFEMVSVGLKSPFLEPISRTMQSLLTVAQTVKKNKDNCITMLEQIHELLYAIIHLHVTSETGGELLPNMLNHLGKFTETLHKIYTFVEAQQDKSRIVQFFRQGEMSTLLKGCHLGLEEALEAFKVQRIYLSRNFGDDLSPFGWNKIRQDIHAQRSVFQLPE